MTPRIEKTVFISYRRTNFPWAYCIYQDLTHHGYDVFFDFQSIDSGSFEKVMLENIRAKAHFIVILAPSALERCNEPNDWLRREIETAMDERRNIIPVMLEGFDFGTPLVKQALTGKLASLSGLNGMSLVAEYVEAGLEKLRNRFLTVPLENVYLHALPEDTKQITADQKVAADKTAPVEKEELTAQECFERGYLNEIIKNYSEAVRLYSEATRLQPEFYKFLLINNIYKGKGDETQLKEFRLFYDLLTDRRPSTTDQSLKSALESLANQLARTTKDKPRISIDIKSQGQYKYPETIELQLYEIISEACINAFQHANAERINITGDLSPSKVEIEVEDDGIGFGPNTNQRRDDLPSTKQPGLTGMYQRAKLINAKIEIFSKPTRGIIVRVTWESKT